MIKKSINKISKSVKWILMHTFASNGKLSAPQLIGAIICFWGMVLLSCHYTTGEIVEAMATGATLLTAGIVEVVNSKKKDS